MRIVLIGASGHGKVCAEIAWLNGYDEILFLDDNEKLHVCGDWRVVGKSGEACAWAAKGYDLLAAVGDAGIRQRMMEEMQERGISCATLVHPAAVVAEHVEIGAGSVVMAGAVINPGSRIGKGCIINTCASVDHDCRIEDFVHVSVGAHLAGTVRVGRRTWIGIGAAVSNNVEICADCMIGAGTVVIHDIKEKGTYAGVPAKQV